jgi:hypothetical protein
LFLAGIYGATWGIHALAPTVLLIFADTQTEGHEMSDTWKDERKYGREKEHPKRLKCGSTGKWCFRSPEVAMDIASKILASPQNNAPMMRSYRCEFCNLWHLSSKP